MSQADRTAVIDEPRGHTTLQALRDRGEHYALLNAALKHLDGNPGDTGVTLLASQSYIDLGLIGPARDLLSGVSDNVDGVGDIGALRGQIARAPSGRVAWGSLQSRFERNLALLYPRYPHLRRHDDVFRGIARQNELYRTKDGNLHLAKRSPDGSRRWVPDLCDTNRALASGKLPHNPGALFCGPYLVAGDRLGALFDCVFDATKKMFLTFSPRIYVLEADAEAFGVGLYTCESVERLCHPRTEVFIGSDCAEQLAAFIERDPTRAVPEFAVRLTPAGEVLCDLALKALQPGMTAIEARVHSAREAAGRYYDSLPADHWRKRFDGHTQEPLRVLGITSRFTTFLQYSMRDWGAAFESRGHEFRVLIEENDHDVLPPIRLAEAIDEYKPDLIILIDHLRREYGTSLPENVPFVCWIQDLLPHLTTAEAGRSLESLDFFIAPDPPAYVHRYCYPAAQGMAWTMATDHQTYSNRPLPADGLASYRCDFSYVSSHSAVPRKFHEERRQWFAADPAAVRLTDHLFEAMQRSFVEEPRTACAGVPYLFQQIKEETGHVPASTEADRSLLHDYVYPLAEQMFRQSALEWVANYCDRTGRQLFLYGNGWEDHPRFAEYARGFARNGAELRAIYQASTINMQIVGTGALHQRLLDGLAAGGFFLLRYAPSDVIHEPVKKYLAAFRKYKVSFDTDYELEDVADLAGAEEELWRLRGVGRKCNFCRASAAAVEQFQEMEATSFRRIAGAVFAEYGEVSFATADEFERLAERWLSDCAGRQRITDSMRQTVVNKYSYGTLVDDLLSFIRERLNTGAESGDGQRQVVGQDGRRPMNDARARS